MNFNIVVLISGRGSNLKALIEHAEQYRISGVISDKTDAAGLAFAQQADIPAFGLSRTDAATLIEHKQRIYQQVEALRPDLIVLAGFMQILEKDFIDRHTGKIVNIHPSLLPAFKGLNTHQRALDTYRQSSLKNQQPGEHGCSVHYVDYEVDTGPLIAQARCPLLATDDADSLAARVLEQEHRLFPWVINQMAQRQIRCEQDRVIYSSAALADAERLGFTIPAPMSQQRS